MILILVVSRTTKTPETTKIKTPILDLKLESTRPSPTKSTVTIKTTKSIETTKTIQTTKTKSSNIDLKTDNDQNNGTPFPRSLCLLLIYLSISFAII